MDFETSKSKLNYLTSLDNHSSSWRFNTQFLFIFMCNVTTKFFTMSNNKAEQAYTRPHYLAI